jgi:hypothetical protein
LTALKAFTHLAEKLLVWRRYFTLIRGGFMENLNGIFVLFAFFIYLFFASWLKQKLANRGKDNQSE